MGLFWSNLIPGLFNCGMMADDNDDSTDNSSSVNSSLSGDTSSSPALLMSYESSTFEGSDGSTEETAAHVLPFMYEPLQAISSSSDEENTGDDPRLGNLDW